MENMERKYRKNVETIVDKYQETYFRVHAGLQSDSNCHSIKVPLPLNQTLNASQLKFDCTFVLMP